MISLVFVFNDEKPKFLAHNEKWANHTGHISLFLSVVECDSQNTIAIAIIKEI